MTEQKRQEQQQQRVSKRKFIANVAHRSGLPIKVVGQVYDTGLAELMDIVSKGDQLMLTGFGKFYPQAHKGHRVQFADSGSKVIDDYHVLKFSATRSVNKLLALSENETEAKSGSSQIVPAVEFLEPQVIDPEGFESKAEVLVVPKAKASRKKAVSAKSAKVVAAGHIA